MFKFLRPPKTVLSTSRLPMRLNAQIYRGQVHNVQRVRFQKPGFRPRSIAITVLTIYVGWSVYARLVLDPLGKAIMDTAQHLPEDEEEAPPIFIPFPGTTKQLKPRPYRGSDPEWQEFLKFSRDPGLSKRVREELAQFVRQLAEKHPILQLRGGKGMKLRRYWLDVDFPTHPPPEFERSGIEITDDYIAWTTMPVDSSIVFKIRQALWPSALAKAFWSFTKVMISDDARRVARLLGLQADDTPPTIEQLLARHQQMIRGSQTNDGSPKPKQPQLLGDAQTQKAIVTVADNQGLVGKPPLQEDLDANPGKNGISAVYAHFFRGIMAFKMKLQQSWRPAPDYPPRGSIIVQGLVELDSPKAWLVFDVKAAWDPKTKSYDSKSMRIHLKRMQMKRQGPLGGA